MNEFEAHESSYDHQHKKRLKEMKQMQRDPLASTKARKAERKADEKSGLISFKPVKLDAGSAGGGFKKGGFKSAFGGSAEVKIEGVNTSTSVQGSRFKKVGGAEENKTTEGADLEVEMESETDEEDYYDPKKPTGCHEGCPGLRI